MVYSIGIDVLLIPGIVLMKKLNLFLKPFTNAEYAAWDWLSATADNMHS